MVNVPEGVPPADTDLKEVEMADNNNKPLVPRASIDTAEKQALRLSMGLDAGTVSIEFIAGFRAFAAKCVGDNAHLLAKIDAELGESKKWAAYVKAQAAQAAKETAQAAQGQAAK